MPRMRTLVPATTLPVFGLALVLSNVNALGFDANRPAPQPQPQSEPQAQPTAQADPKPATPPAPTNDRPAPAPAPNASPEPAPAATPAPAPAKRLDGAHAAAAEQAAKDSKAGLSDNPGETRVEQQGLVKLAFRDEKVESFIPYIQEWTGKAVMLRLTQVAPVKITLVYDKPITKHEALNLVFQAFRLNGIGVVETDKIIMIDLLTELPKLQPGIVLPPEASVMELKEDGNIVHKTYRIRVAKASDIYERLQDVVPDYAKLSVDINSNQILLEGDVGLAKKIQLLIDLLDVPAYVVVQTETFNIKFQDASVIADNIRELFEGYGQGSGGRSNRANQQRGNQRQQPGGPPQVSMPQVGTSEQLVVTTLPSLNSITVRAEPLILDEIRRLITTAWDLPPNERGEIFHTYDLKYTDPLKIRDTLQALLESGGGGSRNRSSGRASAGGRLPQIPGQSGESGAEAAVANVFRIEAYPDSRRLVVISRTPQNFAWLNAMIASLDQPLDVGLPVNVQLKYASAIEVSDILNALLAEAGSGTGLARPGEGLSGINFETAGGGGDTAGANTGGNSSGNGAQSGNEIRFPWQNGRTGTNEQSPESALIGKMRVVPNAGQNSLLVLAPPEIQDAVLKIIEDLDRPGRQVMITAVLAEVSLGDGFAWGLRVGTDLAPLNGTDNSVGGQIDFNLRKGNGDSTGGGNFASPWFDVSLLDINTSVGFLLQALQTQNNVRILQEPRVFTSDNREAKFFAGQDVTFQTGQTTGGSTGGGTTSSFDTKPVGIGLNVRPRITRDKNVAMDIEILLSNLNFTIANINNNPVVDRRQTNTSITVKDGQTIVISGIRREDETSIKRGLPLLGDIPGVGDLLFSSTEKKKGVTELVIFVTPIVVDNPDQNDTNYNEFERTRLENIRRPLDNVEVPRDSTKFFSIGREGETLYRPTTSAQPTPSSGSSKPSSTPAPAPSPSPAPAPAPTPEPVEPPK